MEHFMIILKRTFSEFGLPISVKKSEVMHIPGRNNPKLKFSIQVDDHIYKQTESFKYLGNIFTSDLNISAELAARSKGAWKKFRRYSEVVFDNDSIKTELKVNLFKMEVMEVLLYACVTWTTRKEHFDELQRSHARFLKRLIGYKPQEGVLKTRAYWRCLINTDCEPIETTIRYRRVMWASKIVNQDDSKLTKQILHGEIIGGQRGRGTLKHWRSCLKEDLKYFNLNTDTWMKDALDENWNEHVKEQKAKAIESFFEKSKQQSKDRHRKEDMRENVSDLDEVLHPNFHKPARIIAPPLERIPFPLFSDC
jgi:uncharacterized FlaG/YvyC family protein